MLLPLPTRRPPRPGPFRARPFLNSVKYTVIGTLYSVITVYIVAFPLSRSIMAVIVVFSMVAYWNDWFTALVYLNKDHAPFPLVMRGIVISTEALSSGMSYADANRFSELVKFASMIVAAAPMLILYPFVQKYFEQGFVTGAVKG